MKSTFYAILCSTFFLFTADKLTAQNYDYPVFPVMDITFEHLRGELIMNERGQIRGDITYDIRFNIEKSDSILLNASRMQVDDVLLDERTMDFELRSDTLIIYLDDTFSRNQSTNLKVVYSTTPVFGVLRTYRGTSFSSQLPGSTRHWLPVSDHPGTTFTYELNVTHPASKSLVMSGTEIGNEVISVDSEMTSYRTRTAIPVSSLFFALSDFESVRLPSGLNTIHLHIEQPNSVEVNTDSLMNIASQTLQRMEELTGFNYPYHQLHILALHDLVWENRTFGAGVVTLDLKHDIQNQIMFGIMGQWAGVQMREMQWKDSEPLQLMHGWFAQQIGLQSVQRDYIQDWNTLYKTISLENIDRYKYFLENNRRYTNLLFASKEAIFKQVNHPIAWQDFVRIIYRNTGQLLQSKPDFPEPVVEERTEYRYDVAVDLNDADGEVRLNFNAESNAVGELVNVRADLYAFNETRSQQLTFTGMDDVIVINTPRGLENIELTVIERDDVYLRAEKPFMFWIYQLMNSESAQKRKEAAIGLRQYNDNPDLQLAILDMISSEESADVVAEIVRTLAMVTDGASGTAQIYLDRIGEDQPLIVRIEALEALGAYTGNERVTSRLQSVIVSTEHEELREVAIRSLSSVTDRDQFESIVENLVVRESVLYSVPEILRELAGKGAVEKAVELSETFLSPEFPYSVRNGVLELILRFDQSQLGWSDRIEALLSDLDPRIRYRAVNAIPNLNREESERLLEIRTVEEYDRRVARALMEIAR